MVNSIVRSQECQGKVQCNQIKIDEEMSDRKPSLVDRTGINELPKKQANLIGLLLVFFTITRHEAYRPAK